MKFINRYREFLLLFFIGILVYLWVVLSDDIPFSIVCPFKAVTGLPCPGCGGTRAAQALLQGDLLLALYINPLSCLLVLFYIVLLVWSIYDGYCARNSLFLSLAKPWKKSYFWITIVVIILNGIWNICKEL